MIDRFSGLYRKLESGEATGRIFASVSPKKFYSPQEIARILNRDEKGELVNYFAPGDVSRNRGQKSEGERTYVISEANEKDKSSYGYVRCTGAVVVGIDKRTGKNISILSHQDPLSFLSKDKVKFETDFSKSLQEFRRRVYKDTIDMVMFGGHFNLLPESKTNYQKSISVLSDLGKRNLGVKPEIVVGPTDSPIARESTAVFFETSSRRLFMIRPDMER